MALKHHSNCVKPLKTTTTKLPNPSKRPVGEEIIVSQVISKNAVKKLTQWYSQQKRPLPWRKDRDPYKIWISEIMLQQTTTSAVIPFFKRFITAFPKVNDLAQASLEEVYELWTGLGYYSRARNIHKAAQEISNQGFSSTYKDLICLPGIGPYASRAISSQAFGEKVGVVDGNVNRVYCRLHNESGQWWKSGLQKKIQAWADQVVQYDTPSEVNQALMELGATICLPQNPNCLLCPWSSKCQAFKEQSQDQVPIKKPKAQKEIWLWKADVFVDSQKQLLLTHYPKSKASSHNLPHFLCNKWVFPGQVQRLKAKPKDFDYKHNITRFEIYVQLKLHHSAKGLFLGPESQKVALDEVKKISPFSLVQKGIHHIIKP